MPCYNLTFLYFIYIISLVIHLSQWLWVYRRKLLGKGGIVIIQYASDLHLDSTPGAPPLRTEHLACDVLVFAGDIDHRPGQLASYAHWLSTSRKPRIPVVVVLGNHDLYTHDLYETPEAFREAFKRTGNPDLHLLHNDAVEIPEGPHGGGVTFLGGTLWNPDCRSPGEEETSDYCDIHAGDRLLRWGDILLEHRKARRFLAGTLSVKGSPVVVVTHYPPSDRMLRDLAAGSGRFSVLWLHGHTHETVIRGPLLGEPYTVIRSNPWAGTDGYLPNPRWDPTAGVSWPPVWEYEEQGTYPEEGNWHV